MAKYKAPSSDMVGIAGGSAIACIELIERECAGMSRSQYHRLQDSYQDLLNLGDELMYPNGTSTATHKPSRPAALITKLVHMVRHIWGRPKVAGISDAEIVDWFHSMKDEILALATPDDMKDHRTLVGDKSRV